MDETDAMRYFNREDYKHALEIYLELLEAAQQENNKERIAYNANLAGLCLYFMHKHSDAMDYFNIALDNTSGDEELKVRKNIDEVNRYVARIKDDIDELKQRIENERDIVNKGILLSNLGILQFLLGQNNSAERSFKKAERIFRNHGDKVALGAIYSNLAMIYEDMQKLDYLYLALDIFEAEGHLKGQADTYHTLCLYYLHQDRVEEAYYFLKKEIAIVDNLNDPELKERAYGLAADLAMEMGDIEEGMKFTESASGA